MIDERTTPKQERDEVAYWQGAAAGYHAEAETPPEASDHQRKSWREGYSFGNQTRNDYAVRR